MTSTTIPIWIPIVVLTVSWACLIALILGAWYLLCEFNATLSCDQELAPTGRGAQLSTTNHSVALPVPDHNTVADEFRTWEWPVESYRSPAHTVRRVA